MDWQNNAKLRVDIPVAVEGKYDKIKLCSIIDANIVTTDGFGIFSSAEKTALIRRIAEPRGIIVLTDSDGAGLVIRNYFKSILPKDKLIHLYSYMDGLELCGIYTHFHSAFCNKKATDLQMVSFRSVIRQLQEKGFNVGICHCCNSAGLLRFPNYAMDAVRVGSAILGRLSFKGSYNLKRVGTLEATVDELRWLPKGHTCGYGAGWKAKKPTRIAVLPVGWYNGFGCQMGNDLTRRRDSLRGVLSNLKQLIFGRKGYTVLLGTKRCKVLGHIGMLHTVIDVTDINCKLGDKAIFDVNPLLLKGVDVIFQ